MLLEDLNVSLSKGSHAWFSQLDWACVINEMALAFPPGGLAERFLTEWVTHGAKIRAQVNDDAKLAIVLRRWLPQYMGPAMQLFRGESADRHDSDRIGFCWTPRRDVAEMFARGPNATRPNGGVLQQIEVSAEAIIAAPGRHSRYLGEDEYTVDPAMVPAPQIIGRYQPADRRSN